MCATDLIALAENRTHAVPSTYEASALPITLRNPRDILIYQQKWMPNTTLLIQFVPLIKTLSYDDLASMLSIPVLNGKFSSDQRRVTLWRASCVATKWWIRKDIGMIRSYIYWSNTTNNILHQIKFEAYNGVQFWAHKASKQRALLTNNGYWYKDNKSDGRILTMSTRVNGEGLTQHTVLLLEWGTERARCPVQQYLLNQEQQGWGPNELTIATRLSYHSKYQDA